MTPEEKRVWRKARSAKRRKAKRARATRRDPHRPQAIVIKDLTQTHGLCLFDNCTLWADREVTWQHYHRGWWKSAKRHWCRHHAGFFARKHGAITEIVSR